MIAECLQSVASQTRPAESVIVVDDGSTDGTAAAVLDWIERQGQGDRFRLLTIPARGGAAAARNQGLESDGDSDLVVFLDSDDLWPDDFLARAERALADHSGAVAASADIRVHRHAKPPTLRDLSRIESHPADILFHDAGIGSATMLRIDAVRKAGGYDESLPTGHDVPLFCAVATFGPWQHISGLPITKREDLGSPGEDGRLSGRYADRFRRWAEIHERTIEEHGARLGVDARTRSRLIAKRWYRAGKAHAKQRETKQARACFRTSIRWHPLTVRPRLKLLGTFLR